MAHTMGMSHGGSAPRCPSSHKLQTPTKLIASLGPSLAGKRLGTLPDEVELALLTRAPKPEGDRFIEVDAPHYRRQRVVLKDGGPRRLTNDAPLSFGPLSPEWAAATHLALIGADGLALWYGPAVQVPDSSRHAEGCVKLDPFALIVRQQ